jgi:hypothetical protein
MLLNTNRVFYASKVIGYGLRDFGLILAWDRDFLSSPPPSRPIIGTMQWV